MRSCIGVHVCMYVCMSCVGMGYVCMSLCNVSMVGMVGMVVDGSDDGVICGEQLPKGFVNPELLSPDVEPPPAEN